MSTSKTTTIQKAGSCSHLFASEGGVSKSSKMPFWIVSRKMLVATIVVVETMLCCKRATEKMPPETSYWSLTFGSESYYWTKGGVEEGNRPSAPDSWREQAWTTILSSFPFFSLHPFFVSAAAVVVRVVFVKVTIAVRIAQVLLQMMLMMLLFEDVVVVVVRVVKIIAGNVKFCVKDDARDVDVVVVNAICVNVVLISHHMFVIIVVVICLLLWLLLFFTLLSFELFCLSCVSKDVILILLLGLPQNVFCCLSLSLSWG